MRKGSEWKDEHPAKRQKPEASGKSAAKIIEKDEKGQVTNVQTPNQFLNWIQRETTRTVGAKMSDLSAQVFTSVVLPFVAFVDEHKALHATSKSVNQLILPYPHDRRLWLTLDSSSFEKLEAYSKSLALVGLTAHANRLKSLTMFGRFDINTQTENEDYEALDARATPFNNRMRNILFQIDDSTSVQELKIEIQTHFSRFSSVDIDGQEDFDGLFMHVRSVHQMWRHLNVLPNLVSWIQRLTITGGLTLEEVQPKRIWDEYEFVAELWFAALKLEIVRYAGIHPLWRWEESDAHLQQLLSSRRIRELELTHLWLTDKTLPIIAKSCSSQLRVLRLRNCLRSERAIEHGPPLYAGVFATMDLSNLEEFEFDPEDHGDRKDRQVLNRDDFLNICNGGKLRVLNVIGSNVWSSILSSDWPKLFKKFEKMEELRLPEPDGKDYLENVQFAQLLATHCPRLESFIWPSDLKDEKTFQQLLPIVTKGCPLLKHFPFEAGFVYMFEKAKLEQVIPWSCFELVATSQTEHVEIVANLSEEYKLWNVEQVQKILCACRSLKTIKLGKEGLNRFTLSNSKQAFSPLLLVQKLPRLKELVLRNVPVSLSNDEFAQMAKLLHQHNDPDDVYVSLGDKVGFPLHQTLKDSIGKHAVYELWNCLVNDLNVQKLFELAKHLEQQQSYLACWISAEFASFLAASNLLVSSRWFVIPGNDYFSDPKNNDPWDFLEDADEFRRAHTYVHELAIRNPSRLYIWGFVHKHHDFLVENFGGFENDTEEFLMQVFEKHAKSFKDFL